MENVLEELDMESVPEFAAKGCKPATGEKKSAKEKSPKRPAAAAKKPAKKVVAKKPAKKVIKKTVAKKGAAGEKKYLTFQATI